MSLVQLPSTVETAAVVQAVQFSSAADLVSFDGTFAAGSIMGGAGNDTDVFLNGAGVGTSSVVKLEAGDDSLTFNGNIVSGQFGAGAAVITLAEASPVALAIVDFLGWKY